MKTFPSLFVCALMSMSAGAADTQLSATELAARMNSMQQDGTSFIRLRMEIQQPPGNAQSTLQVQIKQRRTKSATEVVYQILWPKDRAGEAVLLRKTDRQGASGSLLSPPDTLRQLGAAQMRETLFGSSLSYADVVENFFAWEHQTLVGTETMQRAQCLILESKPGRSDSSIYTSVRSWVDARRLVPLRVEKYVSSGRLARRIDTTRVVFNDGHHLPASMMVYDTQKNSATEFDGSNIKRSVNFDASTFTPEGLKQAAPPGSKSD
ncbi:MAG: outer membrane lipoprotein-sorting protein [Verrucomicrobia bacterium]|nr:outer membrane lipoprotein-sorting protein [Verrucomicrobiota bacterium]